MPPAQRWVDLGLARGCADQRHVWAVSLAANGLQAYPLGRTAIAWNMAMRILAVTIIIVLMFDTRRSHDRERNRARSDPSTELVNEQAFYGIATAAAKGQFWGVLAMPTLTASSKSTTAMATRRGTRRYRPSPAGCAPFDGLGVRASYTHTSVQANYTAGARPIKDQLIGLSKNSFNVVGFYDKGPLAARISYTWRDKYLSGVGSTTQVPTFVAAFGTLDGNISVRATSALTFRVEAINIANANSYSYNDKEIQFGEINNYGRTILFGVRAQF